MTAQGVKYYYLACFPARPIRLLQERKYFIGRGEGNNIVISDPEVSRKHAVIYYENDGFVIEDLDSRNGTFLNRKKIAKERIEDGDKVKVGNRVFTVMVEQEYSIKRMILHSRAERQGGETDVIDMESVLSPQSGFAGSLADFGVPEILQVLDLNRKTGKLVIISNDGRGEMYLDEGQVIHARLGDIVGEEAVYNMLAEERGYFEFDMRDVSETEHSIHVKTANLLMEGFRRLDEKERDLVDEEAEAPDEK